MFNQRKQIFSIRKTILGVGSVLLGVLLTSHLVSAEEISKTNINDKTELSLVAAATEPTAATTDATITPTSPVTLAATDPIVTETIIESPIRYVSDPNQVVGYKEVQTQGTTGKLIYTTVNGETTVQRIEPTETVIVLGTKETSVVTATTPAETVYSIDTSKPVGDDVIIPAVDGTTTTTTTYKVETNSTAPVSDAVTSEAYKWTDSSFYHIDQTQTKPSDRVVIDSLFVQMPPATLDYNLSESTIRELNQYNEYQIYEPVTTTNPDGSTSTQYVLRKVTGEMLDPTNAELRQVLSLTDDKTFYSAVLSSAREDLWITSSEDFSGEVVPFDLATSTDDYLRYNNSNVITDAMYADIKADYLRAKEAEKQLTALGGLTAEQQSYMTMIENQFISLTQRYNNYKDSVATTFDYSGTTMSDVEKAAFEAQIQQLPEEMRRVITTVAIYDGTIPGMGVTTLGLSNSADRSIALQYTSDTNRLVATLIHEMTHLVDFKSGMYTETTDRNTDSTIGTVMAFSDTQEFIDVYNKYFDNSNVWSYYRDNTEEAFAEGLSQYIMHRFFGTPYAMYQASPYTNDAYVVYADGYSPFEKSEYYFASLFNKLFEYPRTARVVPYTLASVTTPPINGQVIYGAMPEETTTTVAYQTVYVADPNRTYDPTNQTDIIVQAGIDGQETIRRTYSLDSNNQLVSTDTVISSTDLQNRIISRGTQTQTSNSTVIRTIIYQEVTDNSLAEGEVKVIDQGIDGLERSVTIYTIDPTTGKITSQTTDSTVTDMRPMIILFRLGTPVIPNGDEKDEVTSTPEPSKSIEASKTEEKLVITAKNVDLKPNLLMSNVNEVSKRNVEAKKLPTTGDNQSIWLSLITSSLLFGLAAKLFKKEAH